KEYERRDDVACAPVGGSGAEPRGTVPFECDLESPDRRPERAEEGSPPGSRLRRQPPEADQGVLSGAGYQELGGGESERVLGTLDPAETPQRSVDERRLPDLGRSPDRVPPAD